MATNLTADHTKAFEEALELSGQTVAIDGQNVSAILPLELSTVQELDSNGASQYSGENEITVKTVDLPTISRDSTVTIGAVVFRVTDIEQNGAIAQTLTIETP